MADEVKESRIQTVLKWLPFALGMMVWVAQAIAYFTGKGPEPGPLPPPPTQIEIAGQDRPPPNAFGWVNDPEEVNAVKASLPRPVFAQTPAGQQADPLPPAVYLWDYHRKINAGQNPPVHDQNPVGSCVSFGTSRAFERTLACQIAQGEAFEFRNLCEEVLYALSRVEIGGGRIRGDGSVGAWAAKALTEYGGLPHGQYGRHNLTHYDPTRCRAWGRSGLPDELEPEAKKFPAGDATQVRSWAEAKRALAQGYGISVCSDQGFTQQRDQNGVCRARGSWAHCMCLDGYHTDEKGREYGHIENSWGDSYHVGPTGWGDPNPAGFWAEASVIDRMLKQNDSWAISAVKGFPSRKLDWLVRKEYRRDPLDLHRPGAVRPVFALAW